MRSTARRDQPYAATRPVASLLRPTATGTEHRMSFQAYLDAVERKTGRTPAELLDEAAARGYGPTTKAAVVIDWLTTDYGVGRGHAMALFHVLKNGTGISDKHVGTTGTHRDESDTLRIDGLAKRGVA